MFSSIRVSRSAACCSLAAAALIALAACGSDSTTSVLSSQPPPVKSSIGAVSIDQGGFLGAIKLDVLESAALTATVRDTSGNVLTGQTVTWSSSAPSVATVSNTGVVVGVSSGNTTITATSGGKSATQAVQVLALNLTSYTLSVSVNDDAGKIVSGASVTYVYYGARPAGCLGCNIPYGNFVSGTTDGSGSYTGGFIAAPEGEASFAGLAHTYAYVVTSGLGYETDRRFVAGTTTKFTEPVHLRTMKHVFSGDSLSLTIDSTDPVFQTLDTSPALDGTFMCRTFAVLVLHNGTLKVVAAPTASGGALPLVELDAPDESDFYAFGNGSASKQVLAGDLIEVRLGATIKPGGPSLTFLVQTSVTP